MKHSPNELTQKLNTISGQVSEQTYYTTAAALSTVALLSTATWMFHDSSMNNDQRTEQINDALNNKSSTTELSISSQEIEGNKRLARAKHAYDLVLSKGSNTTVIIPRYNEEIQSIFNQAITEQDNKNNNKILPDANNDNDQANGKRTFALFFTIMGIATGYTGSKDNKKRKGLKAQKTSVEAQIQTLDN